MPHLLASRGGSQVLGIVGLLGGVVGRAQQLPGDAPEVVWDALPHQLLWDKGRVCVDKTKASSSISSSGESNTNTTKSVL